MKPVCSFSSSRRGLKWVIFLSCMLVLACVFCGVIRVSYESCIALYQQTRHIYCQSKHVASMGQEKEIADTKQRIGVKLQQKRKYQRIVDHASRLFDYYASIRRALSDESTLTHCSLSFSVITLTAQCNHRDEIDRVLDQLQKEEQFASVKLRSSEKTAGDIYVYTVVITPKQSIVFPKKRP